MIWCLLAAIGILIWTYIQPGSILTFGAAVAAAGLCLVLPELLSNQPITSMFWSFLPLLTASAILIWSYSRKDFIFSYATMMPAATLYFVVPGLISAEKFKLFPTTTMAVASIYVTLCLGASMLGWTHTFGSVRRLFSEKRPFPKSSSLLTYCCGAMLFSAYFAYKLRGVDSELLAQSQWSGPQTIYFMLTTPGYFIAAVAPIAYLITKKRAFLVCGLIAFGFYLLPPILGGKRNEIIEAGVIAAMCWGLVLRKPIPKPLILAGGAFCAILFSTIGTYRSVAKESGAIAGVMRAVSSEARETEAAQTPEFRYVEVNNYLAVVACYLEGRWPNFGCSYWNALVHGYVPGQIIGENLKRSLQIDHDRVSRGDVMAKGMPSTAGSTFTGFSDTFQAFLLLGPGIFYLTGRFLRSVFLQASRGSAPALFSYSHLLVMSGVSITHSTNYLMTAMVNLSAWMLVWVMPMQLRLGRLKTANRKPSRQSSAPPVSPVS
jgi:hypothetical protein